MISVRQIHPLFAAEVTGVDLAALTPDQVAALQDASNRHAVLVFPGQSLNDDHLLTLGRLFGDVEPPRNHRVQQRLKHAELADISNLTAANALRAPDDQRRLDSLGNRLWHSDASFREVPGALSMLFAHIVPPAGGETEFADLRAAYDALASRHEGEDRRPRSANTRSSIRAVNSDIPTTPTPSAPPCRRCGIRWCGYIRDHGAERSTWARTPRTSSAGRCPTGACCCAT